MKCFQWMLWVLAFWRSMLQAPMPVPCSSWPLNTPQRVEEMILGAWMRWDVRSQVYVPKTLRFILSHRCGRLPRPRWQRCPRWQMPTVAEVTPVALAKPEPSDLSWRASLGPKESYVWARFRDWLGQPRSLNPSLALHGLRPFPFMYQFSIMCIIVEVTWSLVTLLLGNGYVRGLCPAPEPAPLRILGFVYSSVPLQCEWAFSTQQIFSSVVWGYARLCQAFDIVGLLDLFQYMLFFCNIHYVVYLYLRTN